MESLNDRTRELKDDISNIFLMLHAAVILLMHVGYACLDSGSSHSKNTTNLLLMKFLCLFLASGVYYFLGYSLAWRSGNVLIGWDFIFDTPTAEINAHRLFQIARATIATTIISGSLTGRIQVHAVFIYVFFISGITFPLVSRWAWFEEGFLIRIGFYDNAGSGVIHAFSGTCSLVASWLTGPRRNRFFYGNSQFIPGHSVPLITMGVFIIIICTQTFHADSEIHVSESRTKDNMAQISINITLSSCSSALVSLILNRIIIKPRYWSLRWTAYAAIAGLASSACASNYIRGWEACILGVLACFMFYGLHFLVIFLQIDDVQDVFAVHAGGGIIGVIFSPFFGSDGLIFSQHKKRPSWDLFINTMGLGVIISWAAVTSTAIFGGLKACNLLRVSPEVEDDGLDQFYHGTVAYNPQIWQWSVMKNEKRVA